MKQTKSGREYLDRTQGFVAVDKATVKEIQEYIVRCRNVNAFYKQSGVAPQTLKEIMKRGTAHPEQLRYILDYIRIRKQMRAGIYD